MDHAAAVSPSTKALSLRGTCAASAPTSWWKPRGSVETDSEPPRGRAPRCAPWQNATSARSARRNVQNPWNDKWRPKRWRTRSYERRGARQNLLNSAETWDSLDHFIIWLVVWNIFIFPYIWNNRHNWLIFFRGVGQPPTSYLYWHFDAMAFKADF